MCTEMEETMTGSDPSIKDAADAVRGIVEAVPVYQDALQPAAREIGRALETVAKTVHIALAPVAALVWGFEQIRDFVSTRVAEKLCNTPQDEIVQPKPHVAGPILESLRYTGHAEELRELYANLLAASMDLKTTSMAHPSFVEIIKELTPDEAKLVRHMSTLGRRPILTIQAANLEDGKGKNDILVNFSVLGEGAGCEYPNMTPSYLDNLARQGLISVRYDVQYTAPDAYEILENHAIVLEVMRLIDEKEGFKSNTERGAVVVSEFGKQFIKTCVVDHREIR